MIEINAPDDLLLATDVGRVVASEDDLIEECLVSGRVAVDCGGRVDVMNEVVEVIVVVLVLVAVVILVVNEVEVIAEGTMKLL